MMNLLSDFSKLASSFGFGGTRLLFPSVNSITNSLLLAHDLPPPTDIVKLFSLTSYKNHWSSLFETSYEDTDHCLILNVPYILLIRHFFLLFQRWRLKTSLIVYCTWHNIALIYIRQRGRFDCTVVHILLSRNCLPFWRT
jgi:hypothetical protein